MSDELTFRFAERKDSELIFDFIMGIAKYEKMEDEVVNTPELIEKWLFDEHRAEVIFAVFSTTIPPLWEGPEFILRICSCFRNSADAALARRFLKSLRMSPWNATAGVLNGSALTGTARALIFIFPWAPAPWTNGPHTVLRAKALPKRRNDKQIAVKEA